MKLFQPDEILYVVDKRQELHFIQVFRCARKTGLVEEDTRLSFLGFGTMNGKDGKPFKTREGGVMRLENLIADIDEEMFTKIVENRSVRDKDARDTAKIVGLAAIKYGDLSNQATKDYIFDVDRFTSFEGNTGPYILYTIVQIRSGSCSAIAAFSSFPLSRPLAVKPLDSSVYTISSRIFLSSSTQ